MADARYHQQLSQQTNLQLAQKDKIKTIYINDVNGFFIYAIL